MKNHQKLSAARRRAGQEQALDAGLDQAQIVTPERPDRTNRCTIHGGGWMRTKSGDWREPCGLGN